MTSGLSQSSQGSGGSQTQVQKGSQLQSQFRGGRGALLARVARKACCSGEASVTGVRCMLSVVMACGRVYEDCEGDEKVS